MKKIKILLSSKGGEKNYMGAIEGVGAEAVAGYLTKYSPEFDGLVLCGGGDVNPMRYNEELNGSGNIYDDRDEAEFELLHSFVDAGKPVLGICRGHQVINVFFGGSLFQHINNAELHTKKDGVDSTHLIKAEPDSILGKIYGEEFMVNSAHHQAIKELGEGLRATAVWNGECIEAIEHNSLPIFATQWHPERMSFALKRDDTVCGEAVFEYFVELCKKHKK